MPRSLRRPLSHPRGSSKSSRSTVSQGKSTSKCTRRGTQHSNVLMCVREVVQVLETSQDAKRWPHYSEVSDSSSRKPLGSPSTTKPVDTPFPSGPNAEADIKVSVKSPPAATAASSTAPSAPQGPSFPKRKAPGPRKSKTTLAAPPAKSKKLTTLEKSALDWSKHTSSLTDAEELEAHRRGGSGYLDKVDFLNRVEERKEGVLQGSSGGKRRKL